MMNTLQQRLHDEIPITRAIGIEVDQYTDSSLTLRAPLSKNLNHKCTAFGGSLYSVAVLAGWGLVYLLLQKHQLDGHIVIQESNIKFIKPVTSDIIANCSFESEYQVDKFIKTYNRKGLARISLESRITCYDEVCVVFKGSYVVHA